MTRTADTPRVTATRAMAITPALTAAPRSVSPLKANIAMIATTIAIVTMAIAMRTIGMAVDTRTIEVTRVLRAGLGRRRRGMRPRRRMLTRLSLPVTPAEGAIRVAPQHTAAPAIAVLTKRASPAPRAGVASEERRLT
jgi:hypothetical protein